MDSCETASIWTSWCTFGGQVTGLPNQSIGCSARLHSDSELATASIVYTLASPLCDLASDSHGHRHTARRRVGKRSLSRATGRRRNGEAQAYVGLQCTSSNSAQGSIPSRTNSLVLSSLFPHYPLIPERSACDQYKVCQRCEGGSTR